MTPPRQLSLFDHSFNRPDSYLENVKSHSYIQQAQLLFLSSFLFHLLTFANDWSRSMMDGNPIAAWNKSSDYKLFQKIQTNQNLYDFLQQNDQRAFLSQESFVDGLSYRSLSTQDLVKFRNLAWIPHEHPRREHIKNEIKRLVQIKRKKNEGLIILAGFTHVIDYYETTFSESNASNAIYLAPRSRPTSVLHHEIMRRYIDEVIAPNLKRNPYQIQYRSDRYFKFLVDSAGLHYSYHLHSSLVPEAILLGYLLNQRNLSPTEFMKPKRISFSPTLPFIIVDEHTINETGHIETGLPDVEELEHHNINRIIWGLEGLASSQKHELTKMLRKKSFSYPVPQSVLKKLKVNQIPTNPSFHALANKMFDYQLAGIEIVVKGLDV